MTSKRRLRGFVWPGFTVDQLLRFGQVAVFLRALLAYSVSGLLLFLPLLLVALYFKPELEGQVDVLAWTWSIAAAITLLIGGVVAVVTPSRDVLTRRSDD